MRVPCDGYPRDVLAGHAGYSARTAPTAAGFQDIDESCVRILSGYFTVPPARRHPCGGGVCIDRNVSTADHKALARKLSAMSTVRTSAHSGVLRE